MSIYETYTAFRMVKKKECDTVHEQDSPWHGHEAKPKTDLTVSMHLIAPIAHPDL